jgi:hypothetical protein
MNTPVNFELAKLLKEKRFDEECNNYYSQALFEGTNPDWEGVFPKYSVFKYSDYDYNYNSILDNNDLWFKCSAPTIAEVVMWLYEKHEIWISVDPENDKDTWFHTISYNKSETIFGNYNTYNSPTEAYEAAIEYALNNLL